MVFLLLFCLYNCIYSPLKFLNLQVKNAMFIKTVTLEFSNIQILFDTELLDLVLHRISVT